MGMFWLHMYDCKMRKLHFILIVILLHYWPFVINSILFEIGSLRLYFNSKLYYFSLRVMLPLNAIYALPLLD